MADVLLGGASQQVATSLVRFVSLGRPVGGSSNIFAACTAYFSSLGVGRRWGYFASLREVSFGVTSKILAAGARHFANLGRLAGVTATICAAVAGN